MLFQPRCNFNRNIGRLYHRRDPVQNTKPGDPVKLFPEHSVKSPGKVFVTLHDGKRKQPCLRVKPAGDGILRKTMEILQRPPKAAFHPRSAPLHGKNSPRRFNSGNCTSKRHTVDTPHPAHLPFCRQAVSGLQMMLENICLQQFHCFFPGSWFIRIHIYHLFIGIE